MLSCWAACWVMEANSDPTVTLWGEFTHSFFLDWRSREMVLLVDFYMLTPTNFKLQSFTWKWRSNSQPVCSHPPSWNPALWLIQMTTLHSSRPTPHSSPTPQKVLLAFLDEKEKVQQAPSKALYLPTPCTPGPQSFPEGSCGPRHHHPEADGLPMSAMCVGGNTCSFCFSRNSRCSSWTFFNWSISFDCFIAS